MILHIVVAVSQMKKGYYLTSRSEDRFNHVCKTQRHKGDVTAEKKMQEIQ